MNRTQSTKVGSAYLGAILIWIFTPLGVKWSTENSGFLFGATSRSLLAAVMVSLLCLFLGHRLPLNKTACQIYIIGGLGNFGIVFFSLWGIQHIPSAWMALLYATTPIITSLLAALFLNERQYGFIKTGGLLVSVAGVGIIFNIGLGFGPNAIFGLSSIILSVLCYAGSSVAIKRTSQGMDAFSINSGSLIVAAILYVIIWLVLQQPLPKAISSKTLYGILYTAIITSVIGNALFYYILKNIDATRTTLLTLITPICALFIGYLIENEPLTMKVLLGATLVIMGMIMFELKKHPKQRKY